MSNETSDKCERMEAQRNLFLLALRRVKDIINDAMSQASYYGDSTYGLEAAYAVFDEVGIEDDPSEEAAS